MSKLAGLFSEETINGPRTSGRRPGSAFASSLAGTKCFFRVLSSNRNRNTQAEEMSAAR